MKKKKVWIILLSVVLGLFVVFGGVYFATKLSSVNVQFRSRLAVGESRLASGILDTVKDSGEFNYKDSVLFMDTEKNVAKIEKSNPYVKVHQVVRKFPNKIYIYILERVPKYRIKDSENSNSWILLDEEFKSLEKISNDELLNQGLNEKTVEIEFISEKVEVGDFLQKTTEMNNLNEIFSGIYGRTKDYFVAKSIDYSSETDTYSITMKTSVEKEDGTITYEGGCVIQIEGSNELEDRAFKAASFYAGDSEEIDGINLSSKVVILSNKYGTFYKT